MYKWITLVWLVPAAIAGDFTYSFVTAANRSNHDITHNLGSAGVVVQCATVGGVSLTVSVPDANRSINALRVTMPGAGGPFSGKCYISGGTSGLPDLEASKASASTVNVSAGRFGVNSDTYSMPASSFTLLSMPIVSVTSLNPFRFTLTNANYTLLIDGDTSMITVTGGTGCAGVNGVYSLLKNNNTTFEIQVFPTLNATGCSGLTGNVAGTGTGTCYIEATDDGLVRARCPAASGVLLSCTGNCNFLQEAVPEFDGNNVKIATASLTAGTPSTWNVVSDTRDFLSNRRILPGDLLQFDLTQTILSATGNVARRNGGNVFTGGQDFTGATVTGIGVGGISDGDKGDVTVSGSGVTWTIDAGAVTSAKIASTVDFTTKTSTAPIKLGAANPATCTPGDLFLNSLGFGVGHGLQVCAGANAWETQGGMLVRDEGTAVPNAAKEMDCIGAGITCGYNGANLRYEITVPGGGGPGGGDPWQRYFAAAKTQDGTATITHSYGTTAKPNAVAVTGSNTIYAVAHFPDTQTTIIYDHVDLPSSFSTISVSFVTRTSATTGNYVMQFATACVATTETGDPAFNTAQTVVVAANATTNRLITSTISSITLSGVTTCAANETLFWKLHRDPTHASDTIGQPAELVSTTFKKTA